MKITTQDTYMAIAMRVPFETHGLNETYGSFETHRTFYAESRAGRYFVYSYRMEIAAWRPETGWTTDDTKVSRTTTGHQHKARYGIGTAQEWAACENAAHIESILTYVRDNDWRTWSALEPFWFAINILQSSPESAALLDLTPDALRTLADVGAGDSVSRLWARVLLPVVIVRQSSTV